MVVALAPATSIRSFVMCGATIEVSWKLTPPSVDVNNWYGLVASARKTVPSGANAIPLLSAREISDPKPGGPSQIPEPHVFPPSVDLSKASPYGPEVGLTCAPVR